MLRRWFNSKADILLPVSASLYFLLSPTAHLVATATIFSFYKSKSVSGTWGEMHCSGFWVWGPGFELPFGFPLGGEVALSEMSDSWYGVVIGNWVIYQSSMFQFGVSVVFGVFLTWCWFIFVSLMVGRFKVWRVYTHQATHAFLVCCQLRLNLALR